MRHDTLAREITVLKNKIANTPVCLYKGRYSHEGNLSLQLGHLGLLSNRMIDVLVDTARLLSHGEEYQKIIKILEDHRDYLARRHLIYSTGCDWDDAVPQPRERKLEKKVDVGDGVFGRTWEQLEQMQGGGKITR